MKRIAVALISLALVSGAAFAQAPNKTKPAPAVAKLPAKAHCPIMKSEFPVRATSEKSTYKGKTYYFCCAGCKPAFDKNPAKYAVVAKPAPKKPAPRKPAPKA